MQRSKILVSDYDFTLFVNSYMMTYNIYRIKQLRDADHKFAIATARSYQSIIKKIEDYKIPYDYLSCFDGGALYDNQHNLLYASEISKENQQQIESIASALDIVKKVVPLTVDGKDGSLVIEYALNIYLSKLIGTPQNMIEKLSELKNQLNNIPNIKYSGGLLNYVSNETNNKAKTVQMMKEDCNASEVYTIGDDLNDLKMIADFNGYSLPWSRSEIKQASIGWSPSVGGLAKKIGDDKAKIRTKKVY